MKCDFCGKEGNWKTILVSKEIQKEDGSEIRLCDTCINLYHNQEWDKLTERIKVKE